MILLLNGKPPTLLTRIAAAALAAVVLVTLLFFGVLIGALVLGVGLIGAAVYWVRTRFFKQPVRVDTNVLEGEYSVVETTRVEAKREA